MYTLYGNSIILISLTKLQQYSTYDKYLLKSKVLTKKYVLLIINILNMKEIKKNIESHPELCPVKEALKIIGGKWRLQIVHEIGHEKRRFGELKRLIPAISEKMLIQELKILTSYGVLHRKAYPEIPPRVEYSLTASGKSVLPIISQIEKFGQELIENNLK